jgi:hypothetical protein
MIERVYRRNCVCAQRQLIDCILDVRSTRISILCYYNTSFGDPKVSVVDLDPHVENPYTAGMSNSNPCEGRTFIFKDKKTFSRPKFRKILLLRSPFI